MIAKCVDAMIQGLRPGLYVVQNCWSSDIPVLLIILIWSCYKDSRKINVLIVFSSHNNG